MSGGVRWQRCVTDSTEAAIVGFLVTWSVLDSDAREVQKDKSHVARTNNILISGVSSCSSLPNCVPAGILRPR
jgi:hypothetical protein